MTLQDVRDILTKVQEAWPEVLQIESGNENGEYVNVMIESDDPLATYNRIRWVFLDSKLPGGEFGPASIITLTGSDGWNDYLLLHHFDPNQQLDSLEAIAK